MFFWVRLGKHWVMSAHLDVPSRSVGVRRVKVEKELPNIITRGYTVTMPWRVYLYGSKTTSGKQTFKLQRFRYARHVQPFWMSVKELMRKRKGKTSA